VSAVVLVKGGDGKLQGHGDKGQRAYSKFRQRVEAMRPGDTLHFEWREPRSLPHHRLFFAKLGALMDMQEQFDAEDKLRAWLTVGAGYADFVPGPTGRMVALPQSIAFDKLDEADFADLHSRVDAFLWTDHARRFLWPHLTVQQTYDFIDQLLSGFQK
jgi:hypothetical protein